MISYERYRKRVQDMKGRVSAITQEKDTPVLILDGEAYADVKQQLDAPAIDRSGRRIITFENGVRKTISCKTVIIIDDIA